MPGGTCDNPRHSASLVTPEVADEIWNSGRDLTTLCTTPHPSGTRTINQEITITSQDVF
jgi:hypothetical protein